MKHEKQLKCNFTATYDGKFISRFGLDVMGGVLILL